ncbi:MAG: hypothetical protein ABIA75_10790 [Candidatus Neomarinimicrobiota bacterium]
MPRRWRPGASAPNSSPGLQTALVGAETLNNEQEALKAGLKAKTAELDGQLAVIKKQLSEAATIVKLIMDKERWVEFGITAKR